MRKQSKKQYVLVGLTAESTKETTKAITCFSLKEIRIATGVKQTVNELKK
jgi:hypothetical protein